MLWTEENRVVYKRDPVHIATCVGIWMLFLLCLYWTVVGNVVLFKEIPETSQYIQQEMNTEFASMKLEIQTVFVDFKQFLNTSIVEFQHWLEGKR